MNWSRDAGADTRSVGVNRHGCAGLGSECAAADDRPIAGAGHQRHRCHIASASAFSEPRTDVAPDQTEIIITAQKREENVQNVPINVIALGTRRLDQLNISNFEDYTKQLPSVSFLTTQPGQTTVYMRGVSAAGGTNAEGNHSGPLPQVGTYLDEQPVTTIGGTLDVHIYDVARIESLSGPQGTLYGASSEAGTIRIITNKPKLDVVEGRVDGEINSVAHGAIGGKLEGMINLPIAKSIAFRGVGFYERDAGYIDNIFGSRTYYIYDPNTAELDRHQRRSRTEEFQSR